MDTVTYEFIYWYILPIIFGNYAASWALYKIGRDGRNKLWDALANVKTNEIAHLDARVKALEENDG